MQPSRSEEPATVDLSGRCVGNSYVLICPVGQGATGTVWRGIERTSGQQVAVKLLHEGLLRQPKLVTRFVQERTILMMVRHEHIVGVRDLFSVGESLALVMDFVAGGSLRERLRAARSLAPAEAARLLAQVAAALTEAHGLGVVHRDVKPDNILLQATDGRLDVRLTDFGIARVLDAAGLTTPHAIIGTPHYRAPEAISDGDAGPAVDVYALGIVLYELVSGRTPYGGEPLAVLRHHVDNLPDRPAGMPDEVWAVIQSCLDKDPARRPPAAELVTTLRGLARRMAGTPALPASAADLDPADGGRPYLPVIPSQRVRSVVPPAPPRRRRNGPRSWMWGRRGMIVALVAAGLAASGLGSYHAWHLYAADAAPAGAAGNRGADSLGPRPAPSPARTAPAHPPAAAAPGNATAGRPTATVPGGAGVSGGPIGIGIGIGAPVGPAPGGGPIAYGPWHCSDQYTWEVGHPVLARPCHSVGAAIRVRGDIEAVPGVQADVALSIRDAETDQEVAGPYTCAGLLFTDFAPKHSCGPVDLRAPRGRRYVVVESWRYTGRSLLPGGTARGPEFSW